ncbi:MAG: hypothetical protein ACREQ5_10705 [Candidatus Dormibacteria bacterium]
MLEVLNSASGVALPSNGAETVVVTCTSLRQGVTVGGPSSGGTIPAVRIKVSMNITWGSGTTTATFRIRNGSLTGSVIGTAQTVTVTASQLVNYEFDIVDATNVPPSQVQYVMTVQSASTTGAATVNLAVIDVQPASSLVA